MEEDDVDQVQLVESVDGLVDDVLIDVQLERLLHPRIRSVGAVALEADRHRRHFAALARRAERWPKVHIVLKFRRNRE